MITMLNPGRSRRRKSRKRRKRGRNTWFGHPRLHRLAALKGWRKRRRKYKKRRAPVRSRKRGSKKRTYRRKSPRRSYKRRSRKSTYVRPGAQYWPTGRAPRRSRKKKRRVVRALARMDLPRMNNPYKRRAKMKYRPRRRNTTYWIPPYGGSPNPYWVPSYAHNPGVVGAVTRGFDLSILQKSIPVAGGAIGNAWLTGMISRMLPDFLASGPGNYIVSLASAGLLGAGVGAISPRYAGPVFLGGVVETMTRIVRRYVMPSVPSFSSGLGYFNLNKQSPALGYFNLNTQSPALGKFDLWKQSSSLGHNGIVAQELGHQLNYPQADDLNHPTGYDNPVDHIASVELAGS